MLGLISVTGGEGSRVDCIRGLTTAELLGRCGLVRRMVWVGWRIRGEGGRLVGLVLAVGLGGRVF